MNTIIVHNKSNKTFTIVSGNNSIGGWASAQCANAYLTFRSMGYSTQVAKAMAFDTWEKSPLYAEAIAKANKIERQKALNEVTQKVTYTKPEVELVESEEKLAEALANVEADK